MSFDVASMIYRIPAVLFAISIHEYAHALSAYRLGDKSQCFKGRLTLNPLVHLDPKGILMLIVFGFGWGKPVEIDTSYFRNPQLDNLKVSLAGPAANLFLCFLAMFLLSLVQKLGVGSTYVYNLLSVMAELNVWLAFFNLMPIPPLDGCCLVSVMLPLEMARDFENVLGRYGMYILIVFILFGVTDLLVEAPADFYMRLCTMILSIFF